MSKKSGAWLLALLSVLLLSLAFTPYSQTANYVLISIRLAIVAALSILFVRERWKYRHHPEGTAAPDIGDTILRRLRRWYYDSEPRA